MLSSFAIPLQLVLQLTVPGNFEGGNTTLAVDTQLLPQTAVLPPGFTAFPKIGMAYKYFNHTAAWNMARKTCIVHGSNLAIIDSFEKVRIVQSMKPNLSWSVWVGIHRLFGDGEWVSVKTGLTVPVIAWRAERYENDANMHCLILLYDGSGIRAGKCNDVREFVCEIALPIH